MGVSNACGFAQPPSRRAARLHRTEIAKHASEPSARFISRKIFAIGANGAQHRIVQQIRRLIRPATVRRRLLQPMGIVEVFHGCPHNHRAARTGRKRMREIEINLPEIDEPSAAVAKIDAAVESAALVIASKGTLKQYAGCTHWHVRSPGKSGTLEITYFPTKRRAWFKIQASRSAPWIDEILPVLKSAIER